METQDEILRVQISNHPQLPNVERFVEPYPTVFNKQNIVTGCDIYHYLNGEHLKSLDVSISLTADNTTLVYATGEHAGHTIIRDAEGNDMYPDVPKVGEFTYLNTLRSVDLPQPIDAYITSYVLMADQNGVINSKYINS